MLSIITVVPSSRVIRRLSLSRSRSTRPISSIKAKRTFRECVFEPLSCNLDRLRKMSITRVPFTFPLDRGNSTPCQTLLHFGRIIRLVCDNALSSSILQEYCDRYNITLSTSLAWTPQSNGGCEIVHKWLRSTLPILMIEMKCSQNRWADVLMPATEQYNNTVNSVTKFAPNQLMLGYLSSEIYGIKSDNNVQKLWKEAAENNKKAIENRLHGPTFRRSGVHYWPSGTRVIVHPAKGKPKFFATVMEDLGNSCRILKDGRHRRFSVICYKKSRLTKVPDGIAEKDILLK